MPNGGCSCTGCQEQVRVAAAGEAGGGTVNLPIDQTTTSDRLEFVPIEPTPLPALCERCRRVEGSCVCRRCAECDEMVASVCQECERCRDCCEDVECRRCGRMVELTCEVCGRGMACCCSCANCVGCDGRFRSGLCCNDHCEACCDCGEDEDEDADDGGIIPLVRAPGDEHTSGTFHDDKKVRAGGPVRYVSAEIEISSAESDDISNIVRRWGAAIVEDGSLPSGGREINTAPARGSKWRQQIDDICCGLADSNAKANASCGLHVHVDARDCTYYEIRRLMMLYARIEPALFRLVAPSRKSSQYCIPCGPKFRQIALTGKGMKELKKDVFRAVYGGSEPDRYWNKKELQREKYNGARYTALNLHSWVYRGTIECRMHHGTVNAQKIKAWGELWSQVLEFASKSTDKAIDAMAWPEDMARASGYCTSHQTESYRLLRNTVLARHPELQAYYDSRAHEFGSINLTALGIGAGAESGDESDASKEAE